MLIVSKPNQALVVPPFPGHDTLFPGAASLPDGKLVLRHDLPSLKKLTYAGFPEIPNPMLLYYDWPGNKPPFAVQRATCKLLTENPRCYVLNHMGTGKTKTVLWAWDYLNKNHYAQKLLVVAPLSTLNFVWGSEIFRTLPHRRVVVLYGTKEERLARLAQDADIYVINHDGVKVIAKELAARADIDTLTLDELAVYRNNSARSKLMRSFAARFTYVWGLTGAPMPNEPTDVWAQCQIITPHTVPKFRGHARHQLMMQISPYIWKPKADAVDTAFRWMQPAVRYALDDVVELPPLIERTVDVALSIQQKKVYESVRRECAAMVAAHQITAANAGAALNKLLQIAGGWVYTKAPDFVRLDGAPRIVALYELIQAAENKVIVFVPYRHMIEGLSKVFAMKGIDIDHEIVHGDTVDREAVFTKFQHTDKPKVLLAHPGCISHGLTLTAADTTIWYLPIASLETYDQANARIRRVGQAHKQQVIHLCGTPAERRLYRLLQTKQTAQNRLLDLFEDATEAAI